MLPRPGPGGGAKELFGFSLIFSLSSSAIDSATAPPLINNELTVMRPVIETVEYWTGISASVLRHIGFQCQIYEIQIQIDENTLGGFVRSIQTKCITHETNDSIERFDKPNLSLVTKALNQLDPIL